MKTAATGDTVKTITTHYIDGSFVESHGREVMNVIKPTNGHVIARAISRATCVRCISSTAFSSVDQSARRQRQRKPTVPVRSSFSGSAVS